MGRREVEYKEGREVAEKFEEAMKLIFRSPKPEIERKQTKKSASLKKPKKSDRD
jgi:hypothetical protein